MQAEARSQGGRNAGRRGSASTSATTKNSGSSAAGSGHTEGALTMASHSSDPTSSLLTSKLDELIMKGAEVSG